MLEERTAELRQLKLRAYALQKLGQEARVRPLVGQLAIAAYRDLKGDIEERQKLQRRAKHAEANAWFESVFESALRNAHIAMKSPTQTSPNNPRWVTSVTDLQFEIDYHLDKLEKSTG
jgi:hypothetical protein